jgi:hypothetical protein
MNIVIQQFITQEIMLKCVMTLSSSIVSSYNLYNFILSNTPNEYKIYTDRLRSTDIIDKLKVASSLIRDVIHRHHGQPEQSINDVCEEYKKNIELHCETVDDTYDIITCINNNTIITDIPEPVKDTLVSTIHIINQLNEILERIERNIKQYAMSYTKYFVKLHIHDDVELLMQCDVIFDKRLFLLIQMLNLYKDACLSC